MLKASRITLLFSALATATFTVHATVDVPPLRDGPPFPIKIGEERKSKRMMNGTEFTRTGRLINENTFEGTDSTGCVNTVSTKDIYAPNLTWKDCGQGPWSTGRAEDMRAKGALWPFKIGNEVHYQWKSINSSGQTNNRAFRSCEVTDTVMAEAAGKQYPSYRINCSGREPDMPSIKRPKKEGGIPPSRSYRPCPIKPAVLPPSRS
jgi:hypothetical protein